MANSRHVVGADTVSPKDARHSFRNRYRRSLQRSFIAYSFADVEATSWSDRPVSAKRYGRKR